MFQSFNFRNREKLKPFYGLVSTIFSEELGHVGLRAYRITAAPQFSPTASCAALRPPICRSNAQPSSSFALNLKTAKRIGNHRLADAALACRRGDRMKRREVITGLVGSLAFPRGLAAQLAERTYRLGVLSPGLSSYDTLRGQLAKTWPHRGSKSCGGRARWRTRPTSPNGARIGSDEARCGHGSLRSGRCNESREQHCADCRVWAGSRCARLRPKSLPPWRERNRRIILAAELDSKRLQLLAEAAPGRPIAVLLHPATQSYRDSQRGVSAAAGVLACGRPAPPAVLTTDGEAWDCRQTAHESLLSMTTRIIATPS